MSRAVIRQFVRVASAKTRNQWCKWPALSIPSLFYAAVENRICIFAVEALCLSWMLLALLPCIVSWKADSVASILCEEKLNLVFLIIHGLVSGMCYCGTEDWRQTLSVFHSVLIWQNFTVFYLSSLNCQFSLKGSIAAAPLKSQWIYLDVWLWIFTHVTIKALRLKIKN